MFSRTSFPHPAELSLNAINEAIRTVTKNRLFVFPSSPGFTAAGDLERGRLIRSYGLDRLSRLNRFSGMNGFSGLCRIVMVLWDVRQVPVDPKATNGRAV